MKLADGSMLRCVHNHSEGARLPDYAAQPAMVLKLEDGSDILLPLIVRKCCTLPYCTVTVTNSHAATNISTATRRDHPHKWRAPHQRVEECKHSTIPVLRYSLKPVLRYCHRLLSV